MTQNERSSDPASARPRRRTPSRHNTRATLGAAVLAASIALPFLSSYLPIGPSALWPTVVALAGGLVGVGLLSHDQVLAWSHEFRAWRRKRRFDVWMRIGNQLLETQDYDRAAYWYERLVDEYPSSVEAWYGLASCLEDAQAFDDASRAYERADEVASGGDEGFLASAAKCAWEADRRDRAVDLLSALAQRDPEFASQLLQREEYQDLRADERLHEHVADDGLENATPYA